MQMPPEYEDAALEFAANLLRTISASYEDSPLQFSAEGALRFAARQLDAYRVADTPISRAKAE